MGIRKVTRRGVIATALAAGVAGGVRGEDKKVSKASWDSVVVGSGVFGAWTAWHLRKAGQRVLLLDAFGAAHARASSGGESRLTRGSYGSDEIYTRFAFDSLPQWKWLSDLSGLPILHQIGVLFFFQKREAYVDQSLEVHRRLKLPTIELDRAALEQRYPQVYWKDIEVGLFEPEFGVLMARRAVQTLVKQFVKAGGEYRVAAVKPPAASAALTQLELSDGSTVSAANYVFACGPWLPKVFPRLLGPRIFPTRQEVFFFAPPAGDARFGPAALPGWADFNNGDIFYGMPDLEARGFKVANDKHGLPIDPDRGDRVASPGALADARAYLAKRFPALAGAQLNEERVCQYENSSNGDLLIDRHPTAPNVLLVGAGSGHGFKHGPEVGRYASELLTAKLKTAEPRFSLETKAEQQNRAVH
ncbi:MAG TPA: FAD-dependent oxidoreductase [Steroidobacteraceae bacterium]|nr:FAD-dependent oxidoreductase [Steroidobacteraceae bacterium]